MPPAQTLVPKDWIWAQEAAFRFRGNRPALETDLESKTQTQQVVRALPRGLSPWVSGSPGP